MLQFQFGYHLLAYHQEARRDHLNLHNTVPFLSPTSTPCHPKYRVRSIGIHRICLGIGDLESLPWSLVAMLLVGL